MVPRPGEFMVVSTDRKYNPEDTIKIPLKVMMKRTIPMVERSLSQLGTNPVGKFHDKIDNSEENVQKIQEDFASSTQNPKSLRQGASNKLKTRLTTDLRDIMKIQ